jgi:ring-1,2-phenylacetyl-CoA epoxidase subunit PaaD
VVSQIDQAADTAERAVWLALDEVHDPEIPPCSITDLGIVERIRISDEVIEVDLLPTFAGCPALDVIRQDAEAAVRAVAGHRGAIVRFVYAPPWTSDRITEKGRAALREYGVTPPGGAFIPLAALTRTGAPATCPFCGSDRTEMESAFGPTLCRSTHYCRSCRNPFEAFKPKTPIG